MSISKSVFSSVTSGLKYTTEFKQYLRLPQGKIGSYFHDIPITPNSSPLQNVVNMVVEVPRWSNAKFEISTSGRFNPIVQDTKKGKIRFVNNIFPYHGYITNYGAIPQTWEDPGVNNGDNDPLDCCEIGSDILQTGTVAQVKILGSLALIDDGEMDWKLIGINSNDSLYDKLNNISDVESYMPGLLPSIRTWFKNYKKPTGKPENQFAFDAKYLSVEKTMSVVQECHESWERLLLKKSSPGVNDNILSELPCTERSSTATDDRLICTEPTSNAHVDEDSVEFDRKWYYV